MKYSWSSLVDTPTIFPMKRSCGQLLLSSVFCILMLGCNSQSTVTDNAENQTASGIAVAQATSVETSSATEQLDEDKGTSLMDAAKDDRVSEKSSSPMIAEKRDSSTLEATLIGEYRGMLSCSNCDGITWTLNLHSDGTVTKTSVYSTPQASQPIFIESGIYRQDDNLITIVYDEENIETYGIQDNHLIKLDAHKKPDADYTLSRI